MLASEAFRPLITLRRKLLEAGGRLVLCHLAPPVAQAFHSTRLIGTTQKSTSAFEVQPNVAAAIASLNQEPAEG
jgi:hypothetical protein